MAVAEGVNLVLDSGIAPEGRQITVRDQADDRRLVGWVNVEILEGNVVIHVVRADESTFGPVSLVVV